MIFKIINNMFNVYENCFEKEFFSSITFNQLVSVIRQHPNKNEIEKIIELKASGDLKYKKIKKKMLCISPNSNFKRSLGCEEFNGTRYMYFDFDIPAGKIVDDFKASFIEKHGSICSLITKSITNGGISVLVNINYEVNSNHEYKLIYNYILDNFFFEEKQFNDKKVRFINTLFFIPSDANAYFNYNSTLNIKILMNKIGIKPIIKKQQNNIEGLIPSSSTYKLFPEHDVKLKLVYRTAYSNKNKVFDYEELEYTNMPFLREIKDGQKHKIYYTIIHILKHLNPNVEDDYIYSYLYYLNKQYTDKPMIHKRLIEICNYAFNSIKNDDYNFSNYHIKKFHFNPKCKLSKKAKMTIVNKVNGVIKRNETINRIEAAKLELNKIGQKITAKSIQKITGISIATVKRHYKSNPINIDEIINEINESDFN